ncbi:MAG: SPFH domain-containing protein [Phycisphaeraceae bacterium]
MKNTLTFLIGLVLVAVLLVYMITYQVAYDEVAVVTTFNNADPPVLLGSAVLGKPVADPAAGADAEFTIEVIRDTGESQSQRVVVPAEALADNRSADSPLAALRDDVAAALGRAGLGETLEVEVDRDRLVLSLAEAELEHRLAIPQANAAARELGITEHVATEGSLKTEAGLYFRWPWPVQEVTTYSRKVKLLEQQLEEVQVADGSVVVVKTYLAWRITDPYAFFSSLGNEREAEKKLSPMMREITSGMISSYRFDELVSRDPDELKLTEIEQKAAEQLQGRLDQIRPSYGIEVGQVGIRRVLLPEETTSVVFDRMRQTRERMAENARAAGRSRAGTIRSEAETARERIMAFARRRAQAIMAEGDREAASYYAAFRDDPDTPQNEAELAGFLRQIEALKRIASHNTTFVLDAQSLSVLDLLGPEQPGEQEAAPDTVKLQTPATPELESRVGTR